MTAPKRDARARLAIAGLLLIPLVALWLLVSPRLSPTGGGAGARGGAVTRTGDPETPGGTATRTSGSLIGTPGGPAPAARVASGAPMQAGWTLLAVTRLGQGGMVPLPPALAPPAGPTTPADGAKPAVYRNPFLISAGVGTGLWLEVRGGLGIKRLTVPQDGRRHAYPFGNAVLVVEKPSGSSGYSYQWTALGGAPLSGVPPYQIVSQGPGAAPGRPAAQAVMLVPSRLAGRFRVTARPLSADGKPLGAAAGLECQPVTENILFTQIPSGYSAETHQFQVTAARTGPKTVATKNADAVWRIAGLPPSVQNGLDSPPTADLRIGGTVLHADASESQDTSGFEAPTDQSSDRRGVGPAAVNIDQHQWTGLPTVRYRLTAHAEVPAPAGQSWLLRLDRVRPQWSMPPSAQMLGQRPGQISDQERPLGFFPLTASSAGPASKGWTLQDGEVGTAFPGQQHWVKIDGTALRSALHTETLTLHDADVVYDAGFGGDRLVWHHPETVTTASGIRVTVLNGRPGRRDTNMPEGTNTSGGSFWWYDRGNAELLLAWHLPPGFESSAHADLSAPRVATPPRGVLSQPGRPAPPLQASWDDIHPDPYGRTTAPPGEMDSRPLLHAGFTLLRVSVWAAQTPKQTPLPMVRSQPVARFQPGRPPMPASSPSAPLPPYSWRDGFTVFTATPLPRHLKTLTLQIPIREEQEQRPVHLVVPVRASLPPG